MGTGLGLGLGLGTDSGEANAVIQNDVNRRFLGPNASRMRGLALSLLASLLVMFVVLSVTMVAPAEAAAQCSAGVPVAESCGAVPFAGCCLDFGVALFCENGVLCGVDCGGNPAPADTVCGWRPGYGIYDCGGGGGDPSGLFSISCEGLLPEIVSGGGGSAGCGDVAFSGCCAGDAVRWCEDATVYEIDCRGNPEAQNQVCGWRAAEGLYDCGGVGADPSGHNPRDCAVSPVVCTPACGGVECGPDGCGGSCGQCEAGWTCESGRCRSPNACVPTCQGKACGDDGCGGPCGACGVGSRCDPATFQCVPSACVPACDGRDCGDDGCGGSCGSCGEGWDCGADSRCVLGVCEPACEGRVCGDNGCGGSCGSCDAGFACNAFGLCAPYVCEPACEGRLCGDDGCGGSCGGCDEGFACNDFGLCAPHVCVPDCEGRVCGTDGCGGACGACADGLRCNAFGLCEPGESSAGPIPQRPSDGGGCPAGFEYVYGYCVPYGTRSGDAAVKDGAPVAGGACDITGEYPGERTRDRSSVWGPVMFLLVVLALAWWRRRAGAISHP